MKYSIKKVIWIVLSVIMMAVGSIGCSSQDAVQSDSSSGRVGVVFGTGGLGDQSFNDLVYEGVQKAEADLGISYDYSEPKQVSDIELMLREMSMEGIYDVIIAVGFDAIDPMVLVSAEYPEQKFALIDGEVEADNVVNYMSKEEEASFLIGAMAALMKQDAQAYNLNNQNTIGFVGALDIPLIRKFYAGYVAGAKYIDPTIEVLDDYVGSFADVTTAKEIGLSMESKGADVIYHAAGGSGIGIFQAAKDGDFIAFGANSNQNGIEPNHIAASMLKRVDTAAYRVIEATLNDEFKSGVEYLGLSDEGVDYTVDSSNIVISEEVLSEVDALKAQIITEEIDVPETMEELEVFEATLN